MENGPKTISIDGVEYVRKDAAAERAAKVDGMEYCIFRCDRSGVFAGYLKGKELDSGRFAIEIVNSRRLHQWFGASLSQVARDGVVYEKSRIAIVEPSKMAPDCIEIIPATEKARENIEGAPEWTV